MRFKFFFFNAFFLIISTLIFKGIDIYFTSYVASKIGSENLGIYSLVMSTYLFGITLATSGINLSVTKCISEELALSKDYAIPKIMKKALLITLLSSTFASLIFFLNSKFIVSYFLHNKVSVYIIYLICLALPLISMSSAISGYFAGVRRIYKNAIGQFIEHISKVIVTAFLLSIYLPNGLEFSCFALILGDLISEIISFCYIYIFFLFDKKIYNKPFAISNNSNYSYKILKVSSPVAITSYIRSGLSTLKQLLIPSSLEKSGISCSVSLAKYGIINGMAIPIIMFPDLLVKSFASLVLPEFSRYFAKKDIKRIKEMTNLLLFFSFVSSAILAFFFYFSANTISVLIYKNIEVSYYLKLLAPLTIFIYTDTVVDSILRGIDAQVGVMIINIFDLIFSSFFIYFCVPKLGILGYIISLYISEILNFFFSFFTLLKIVYGNKNKKKRFK